MAGAVARDEEWRAQCSCPGPKRDALAVGEHGDALARQIRCSARCWSLRPDGGASLARLRGVGGDAGQGCHGHMAGTGVALVMVRPVG